MVFGVVWLSLLIALGIVMILAGGPLWPQHVRFLDNVLGPRSDRWRAWERFRVVSIGAMVVIFCTIGLVAFLLR